MKNKQIKDIVEEKIIAEILEARPKVSIDKKFKKELYKELMERVSGPKQKRVPRFKLSYAFVGAVAVIVIVVGVGLFHTQSSRVEFKFTKTSLNDEAFGPLVTVQEDGQSADASESRDSGIGGGAMGGGGGTAGTPGQKIADYFPFPEYVYTGEDIKLEQTKVEVLRRKNRMEPLGILKSFGLGLVDLSVFKDAKIQTVNVNFVQDKEYGYNVFINFEEGTISIDAYWPRWPQPYNKCADDRCIEENRIKFSDIPADEELIRIANQFIAEHKISLKSYGQPEEENDWRNQPGILEAQIYVPDSITLIYPLLIDGKSVYEQNGTKLGIRVGINIREKRVSGMYNLSLQEYESSMYDAETDFSRILKFAESGGINRYYWNEGKTRKVEIGTPAQEYMVVWKYDRENQMNKMLIIPALIFPTTETPVEGYYYQKNIIVPLAKELLEENENPVPLLKEQ